MTTRLILSDAVSQTQMESLRGFLRHVCGSSAWVEDYRGERFIDLSDMDTVQSVRARFGDLISDIVII
jgi:hypothetical protein